MKINLVFAELHTPLFLSGVNWGVKLDIKNTTKGKITLSYDREEKELLVKAKDGKGKENVAIIPTSNVVSMTPEPTSFEYAKTSNPASLDMVEPIIKPEPVILKKKPGRQASAQVQSPADHVNAGLGAGRTHD